METNSDSIFHCAYNRGRGAVHGEFADALGAVRAVNVAKLLKKYANRRQVQRARHDVIGHLIVEHAAVLPEDFFIESETDGLRDTTGDLPLSQNRVNDLADFLQRNKSSTVTA